MIRLGRRLDKSLDERLYGSWIQPEFTRRRCLSRRRHRRTSQAVQADLVDRCAGGEKKRVNVAGSNVEQVWFVGAHSNVGGGYSDTGLSDIALKWILIEAQFRNAVCRTGGQKAQSQSCRPSGAILWTKFIDIGHEDGISSSKNWFTKTANSLLDWVANKLFLTGARLGKDAYVHMSTDLRLAESRGHEPSGLSSYVRVRP